MYSLEANALFKISEKAAFTLKDGRSSRQIEADLKYLKKKYGKNSDKNKIETIYIDAKNNNQLNCDNYCNYLNNNSYLSKRVVLEINHGNEFINNMFSFNDYLKTKGYKLFVKENVEHFHNIQKLDCFEEIIDKKISFVFYSNINLLEKFIKSLKGKNPKILIELKIENENDLARLGKIKIPRSMNFIFSIKEKQVSNQIHKFFDYKLDTILHHKKGIYQIKNLLNLLKFPLGESIPDSEINYYPSEGDLISTAEKCNNCWAKKMCWTSSLYEMYSPHPSITSYNSESCNQIKNFVEKFLRINLELSESNSPKLFVKDGILLKLINR
jgi:hypothetical protein